MSTTDRPQLKPGEFLARCERDYRVKSYRHDGYSGLQPDRTERLKDGPCGGGWFTDRAEFERHMVNVHNAKPLPKAPSAKPYAWKAPKQKPFKPGKHRWDLDDWHGRIKADELTEGDVFVLSPATYNNYGGTEYTVSGVRGDEVLIAAQVNGEHAERWMTFEHIAGRTWDGRVELVSA